MSRELGVQFARQGIRVNALCPGPVNTPLLKELFAKDPERAARRLVHVPMGRFGEAEEIAAAMAAAVNRQQGGHGSSRAPCPPEGWRGGCGTPTKGSARQLRSYCSPTFVIGQRSHS